MTGDHLDEEVSVSGQLTPTGVEARAKSRAIAAFDRLAGNIIDRLNAPLEARTAMIRAKSDGEIKLINAMAELGALHIKSNPANLLAAIERNTEIALRRLDNKESVVMAAIEDLRRAPPSPNQSNEGSETLEADFMNRFERHAEDASTVSAREKWGRVLASEIRAPGTFSNKALRLIDEIDQQTAQFFEGICRYRIGNAIPRCLVGDIPFLQKNKMMDAGLIFDPSAGQVRLSVKTTSDKGEEAYLIYFGDMALAIMGDKVEVGDKFTYNMNVPITSKDGEPRVPVILLTDAGLSISSIIEDNSKNNFSELTQHIANYAQNYIVRELESIGDVFSTVRDIAPTRPEDLV